MKAVALTYFVAVIICAGVVFGANEQLVNWYSCPKTCTGNCRCASNESPVPNPPQFILLTHDDAVTSFSASTVMNALKGLKNPNGCDLPATFYVSITNSLDYLIHHLFMSNHEIADHTVTHPTLPDANEIYGAIDWMHKNANIPKEEIRGFRAPYLKYDVAQRQTLYRLGLKYDASITERPSDFQLFPYSLDHGVAVDCTTGTCTSDESYPGMWSVPLWTLPRATSAMDIVGDVYKQYMSQFKRKFNGNRAPLGIFCHSGWLNINLDAVRRFLTDALATSEDVWVVTNWQLIQWMQNPVSAPEYRKQMTRSKFCPRSPKGPVPPSKGCLFGNWDKDLYRCKCQAENMPNLNGFCRDSEGSCTVPKMFTNGIWHCPGQEADTLVSLAGNVLENVRENVQKILSEHVPESVKNAVHDNIQNVPALMQQFQDKKVLKNSFYIIPSKSDQDFQYDSKTGQCTFFGIELPHHPLENS